MESKRSTDDPQRRPRWFGAGATICALLCWLTLLPTSRLGAAPNATCQSATVVLVHPKVSSLYEDVIANIAKGMQERTRSEVGVCSIEDLAGVAQAGEAKAVIAIGESAFAAATRTYRKATVVPILVRELPPGARDGVSLFLDPNLYIQQLHELAPQVKSITLVHRDDVPRSIIETAKAAALAHDLHFSSLSLGRGSPEIYML